MYKLSPVRSTFGNLLRSETMSFFLGAFQHNKMATERLFIKHEILVYPPVDINDKKF